MEIDVKKCVYCGEIAECQDHVIPCVYLAPLRSYDPSKNWIVPACNSCNTLAGSFIAFSIAEKAKYIKSRVKIKYRKILNHPDWTQEELNEVDHNLREMIWGGMVAKRVVVNKLKNLKAVSEYSPDYLRPKFVENQISEMKDVLDEEKEEKNRIKTERTKKEKQKRKELVEKLIFILDQYKN